MHFTGGAVELHGHRGARGLRPENTLAGFKYALELGVDAIEFDVGITADGVVVLNHDQALSPVTLADTAPVRPGDPLFPYVGKAVRDLTLEQVKTLEAGVRRPSDDDDPFVLTQLPLPGTALPTLAETCALLSGCGVVLAVELKTDPGWSDADVERFTAAVAEVLDEFGLTGRSRLLAFDWRVLTAAQRHAPAAGRVGLVEPRTLVPGSPWLAGEPPDDPAGSALKIGATALSPERRLATPELVDQAQTLALPVVVWTVNEPEEMSRFVDYGVDAIVTDYPDRLRAVLARRGLPLPEPMTAPLPG
ncbi:putative glycerophosphoryl diester phosphodiesterase precursor [Actinomadura rubrobrunea]|uniref:Glycerophosphoryl diester phosphodiesterase n=1 Tax=Actinomadura rubrobrunea TaxID=115335 RepID=A0A9W6UUP7_9ACTN|nr:glycerophosphodiester phosphodiesterase family protein [Actinomadura rubrobrunea]GLW64861.1 putative glycerophosphoryl diester phosphodiesterase precursor [Actinomadura rubrobrunea]